MAILKMRKVASFGPASGARVERERKGAEGTRGSNLTRQRAVPGSSLSLAVVHRVAVVDPRFSNEKDDLPSTRRFAERRPGRI